MLTLELHTRDIPHIYTRFAQEIGERYWKQRVAALKQEIRGNPFLQRLHSQENAIVFQFEHLRELNERFHGVAVQAYNDHFHYPAASLAAQVLSIIGASSSKLAEQFRGRVRGALKNPNEMRALRLELMTATHFLRAGKRVSWPEMSDMRPITGQRIFDLLVEDLGPQGLEIECKSFSEEKGRRISRRQALEFYWQLRSRHWERLKKLQTGVVGIVTVPRDLPTQHKARLALADALAKRVLHCASGQYQEPEATIRLGVFDPRQLAALQAGVEVPNLRQLFDDITQTRNKEVVAIGTPAGGSLVIAVQSAEDDSLMDSILRTLKDSAAGQFSRTRAAMMVAGFDGLSAEQLLEIAKQDQDPAAMPTALRRYGSKFLASENRDQVVGVTFLSSSSLRPAVSDTLDSGGTAYFFPKRESPFWAEAFSGLFGRESASIEDA